jgi:hypothetical protein
MVAELAQAALHDRHAARSLVGVCVLWLLLWLLDGLAEPDRKPHEARLFKAVLFIGAGAIFCMACATLL